MTLGKKIAGHLVILVLSIQIITGSPAVAQPATENPAATETATERTEESEASVPGTEEEAEFERLLAEWQAQREEVQTQLATIEELPLEELPLEERRAFMQRTSKEGDQAFLRLLSAAETAYKRNPDNKKIESYLLLVAYKGLENDQLEEAARVSILLLKHGYDPKVLAQIAGRASLELGHVDDAVKYLTLARESGVDLSQIGTKYLDNIEMIRGPIDRENELRSAEALDDDLPRVLLETTRGDIVIELFENEVPNAVANFIFLVEQNFYNDMAFCHVRPEFFSATGCPNDNATGTAGYTIFSEPMHNLLSQPDMLANAEQLDASDIYGGHQRNHLRGTVSMIAVRPGVFSSQFMICHRYSTMTQVDSSQVAVGRVIEGMNVATRLMAISPRLAPKNSETDRLIKATVIRKRDHAYRPKTTVEVAYGVAEELLELNRQGRLSEALKTSQMALRIAPRDPNLLYASALCYITAKDFDKAAGLLQRLVVVDPDKAEARRQLAFCYIQMDRIRDATDQLKELTRITPNDAVVFNNLATMLMRQQRKREAIAALEKALELDPDYEQARKNLELLQ